MINQIIRFTSFTVFLLLAFFLFNCSGKNSSQISKETNLIVEKIEKINVLMGSAIGSGGIKPEQYDNFEALKKTASKDELLLLTNHSNAVVRCYSFWALGNYKNFDLLSLVKDHINDNELVKTQFGCLGSTEKVGDFFISLVNPKHENSEIRQLNEEEFSKLESILINKKNDLYASDIAFENAVPTKALYSIVRDLAVKNHNQSALVTLSKYKNPNDIELILKNRAKDADDESGYFFTYKAIQNFPDSRFLPFLEKRLYETLDDDHFDGEWLQLYTAIATYKNQKSLELLSVPFTKVQNQDIKQYHIEFVYEAILANKCKLYDDLLWRIWQYEHIISLDGFKYFLQLDKAKTLELSKRQLQPNYQVKNIKTISEINKPVFTENLEETILNFILINDKRFAYGIIDDKIKNADANDFEMYCAKILELKDSTFTETLFKRLKTEDNAYVYLPIVETLISFKDKSINKRILEIRKKNKNMNEEWGSDSLDEILKKSNIK